MNEDMSREARDRRAALYLFWSLLVLTLFLWQAATYSGLIARAAEWQFGLFGAYRPALTFLLFTAALTFIPLLIDRRRARRRASVITDAGLSSARFLRWLLGSATVCFAISLFCLGHIAFLPDGEGPVRQLDADNSAASPVEGATALRGRALLHRSAVLKEDFWIAQQELRVAPLSATGAEGAPVRFWIELPSGSASNLNNAATVRTGILRENALPGELIQLYRSAGFTVAPDHYVLFLSAESMNWPYRRDSLFWFLMGVLILIGAAVQRLHQRQLIKRLAREKAALA